MIVAVLIMSVSVYSSDDYASRKPDQWKEHQEYLKSPECKEALKKAVTSREFKRLCQAAGSVKAVQDADIVKDKASEAARVKAAIAKADRDLAEAARDRAKAKLAEGYKSPEIFKNSVKKVEGQSK